MDNPIIEPIVKKPKKKSKCMICKVDEWASKCFECTKRICNKCTDDHCGCCYVAFCIDHKDSSIDHCYSCDSIICEQCVQWHNYCESCHEAYKEKKYQERKTLGKY